MPGSTTITASPSRIRVTVPATRSSSPSRPAYPSCSTNTDADPPGAIFTSATEPSLREGKGEGESVQGVGADVVFALGRKGRDGRGHQVAQALDVGREDLEDFGLGDALALLQAGIQVGDQRQRGVAQGQLAGQDRL